MKAEKTRELIEYLLNELADFGADSSIKGCVFLRIDSDEELVELERLAEIGKEQE